MFLLLIQLVNLSVNLPDRLIYSRLSAIYGEENLAYNEMESLTEVVAEELMDEPDAFPEHNEQDSEQQKRGSVWLYADILQFVLTPCCRVLKLPVLNELSPERFALQQLSPPPEKRHA